MIGKLFVISGIQGDSRDLSPNMINYIQSVNILFVEEIALFKRLAGENHIVFHGDLIELNANFKLEDVKKTILNSLLNGQNIGIFESSGTACFIDPGYELVNYIYQLRSRIHIDIVPIPGTSALTLAISVCGFDITNFHYFSFVGDKTAGQVLNSDIPVIYFNQHRSLVEMNKSLDFMKVIEDRLVFVGINLGKIGIKNSNLLLRGTYNHVYQEINNLYLNDSIDDITFIFN